MISSGCRCPWTCTNNSLTESSRWSQSGIEAFHEGNHDHAEKLLAQAIESRPGDPILREHLASIYRNQNKTSEAISQLMQAADLSEPRSDLFVKIGQLYLANQQWIPANQYAKRALEANRQDPNAWVLMADIKLARSELSEALSDYQRALSLNPTQPQVQLKVAKVHQLLGRPMRAYSAIEQMLASIPVEQQSTDLLLLSGRLLMDLRQPAQAVAKLQLASARSDTSPDCFVALANAYVAMGNSSLAQTTLSRASSLYPSNDSIAKQLNNLIPSQERIASMDLPGSELTR